MYTIYDWRFDINTPIRRENIKAEVGGRHSLIKKCLSLKVYWQSFGAIIYYWFVNIDYSLDVCKLPVSVITSYENV